MADESGHRSGSVKPKNKPIEWSTSTTRQCANAAHQAARSSTARISCFLRQNYFVIMRFDGVVGGAAAAGESTKVTHAFQPFGRSDESNSP
jgi:hypothetical protein